MQPPTRETQPVQRPKALGYTMPAEWDRHAATWLAWPHDPKTWPQRVDVIERRYVEFIRAVALGERVDLLVKDDATKRHAREFLKAAGVTNVRYHDVATADSWIRDYGPTFLKNKAGEVAMVNWRFNAWGNKYQALLADDDIPHTFAKVLGLRHFDADLVMEGGSFEVNGAGDVLTTEQCLLNPNRNPESSRDQIADALRSYLGVDRVHWLGQGIEGDDTDGHVDDVARFVGRDAILVATAPEADDPNHEPLSENLRRVRALRTKEDRPFRVIELPMPSRIEFEGQPLPASYANYYVSNAAVVVPVFGQPTDATACRIIGACFPDRTVVPVRAEDVVVGMGAWHCLSQQQPTDGL